MIRKKEKLILSLLRLVTNLTADNLSVRGSDNTSQEPPKALYYQSLSPGGAML